MRCSVGVGGELVRFFFLTRDAPLKVVVVECKPLEVGQVGADAVCGCVLGGLGGNGGVDVRWVDGFGCE